jgi:hypothetical protein
MVGEGRDERIRGVMSSTHFFRQNLGPNSLQCRAHSP